MFRKFRTLEECKARYKAVTVDRSVYRVKQRGFLGLSWSFVYTELMHTEQVESNNSFTITFADKPATFHTEQEAKTAIDKWADSDYRSQPAAWQ